MSDYISHDHEHDGIDRRGFLQCMAWAGTGLLWTVSGGVLASKTLAQIAKAGEPLPATDLSFLQISDSHIGFNKNPRPNREGGRLVAIGHGSQLSPD
jgi:hypothetical protein